MTEVEQDLNTQVALLAQNVGTLTEKLGEFQKQLGDTPVRLAKLEATATTARWVAGVFVVATIGALVTFGFRVVTHYELIERGRAAEVGGRP